MSGIEHSGLARWKPRGCCAVCRSFGDAAVCTSCVVRFAREVCRCRACAMPVPDGVQTCGACLQERPAWMRAIAAVDYAFPWDRLIIDLKFHGRLELAPPLAERLLKAVRAAGAEREVDLLLPVPLAPARLAERGFNQAWEIARRLGAALALPAQPAWLQRPLDAAHQADLPRAERSVNLRGAFLVEPRFRSPLHGRRIALVDDVLTTGATAREATQALLRGGAAAVQVWTVARTP